ncbi:hypothetical protein N7535_005394, partial [Penicillium sp. DV-2018c]
SLGRLPGLKLHFATRVIILDLTCSSPRGTWVVSAAECAVNHDNIVWEAENPTQCSACRQRYPVTQDLGSVGLIPLADELLEFHPHLTTNAPH